MKFPQIKELFSLSENYLDVTIVGWVRTKRELKNALFVEVNDGSCLANMQCTFLRESPGESQQSAALSAQTWSILAGLTTGTSVEITGTLVPSPASGQAVEVRSDTIRIIGNAPAEAVEGISPYPLQKKRHSLEFLRDIAHLRVRTNTFGAVARMRSRLAFGIHEYFQTRGFQYVCTPIIATSDAEGAGAMFQVTALDLPALARSGQPLDYSKDFFGKPAYLTVSGQLQAETYACALSRVYTFGPTFRAENSNTTRHLAEFWMVEPEIAFAHLEDDMALAEDFLKSLFAMVLRECQEDLQFFDEYVEKGVIQVLQSVAESSFAHISYTEAIKELEKKADIFEFTPSWGCDLQSEHEKFLSEQIFKGPVIVTDYPRDIKAFYMKQNEDGRTVRAMDVLVPRLGEIIGGSEREDNLDALERRMDELKLEKTHYEWYLDLRRYGSVPHAGFGLGFERLIQYVTGIANIRDVIPYPRAVGQAEF